MRLPARYPLSCLLFIALGYVPIGALSLSLLEFLPLHLGMRFLVLPSTIATIALALWQPSWGRRAILGFLAGIVATAVYDCTRLGLVWLGVWSDFIPTIGRTALMDSHASPVWGYVWRFLGNGGGMGMAFAMLPWRGKRSGMIYGAFVCCCLYLTLLLAPHAQETMFRLTPVTMAAAMFGHLDYGWVLGWLLHRWLPEPRPSALVREAPSVPLLVAQEIVRSA